MTLLEGTLALAVMSGVSYLTIELANEVEIQHVKYQQAQQDNIKNINKIIYKKRGSE